MFSTVVAVMLFLGSMVVLIGGAYEHLRTKTAQELAFEQLEEFRRGYALRVDWLRVAAVFAVWVASGIYLWG